MPLTGEYEPSPSEWVRDQVAQIEASNGAEGNTMRGVPVVVVTSVGAKSGKLRKNPLIHVEHDGAYALVASKGGDANHPTWYHNLKNHPQIELRDGAQVSDMVTRELTGEERATWWTRATAVWPDYDDYQTKTDRVIPVFLAEPA